MMFKIYWETIGGHTHMRVFAGREEGNLGKCGDLCMRNEEFEIFRERCGPLLTFVAETPREGRVINLMDALRRTLEE